jgi:hypothetical protein
MPDISIPRLIFWMTLCSFFSVLQYTSDIIVVPYCMNSNITLFLFQKTVSINFLASNVWLNFFSLFGECVCIHCFDCSLVSTFTNETQISSPVTLWLRNSSPYLWHHTKEVYKSQSDSLCFACTREHFRNPSCTTLVIAYPNCDNVVENSAWNLWKFQTKEFWNCKGLSFTNVLVNTSNKIITYYRWLTILLFIMNTCSPIFEHSAQLSYSFLVHYILAINHT